MSFHIRFPAEFEYYNQQKYGGKTSYFSAPPPTLSISYNQSENDLQREAQQYHREMSDSQHKWNRNRIQSVADFQHKYPAFPGHRQGAVKANPHMAGLRPLPTSQEGAPLHATGSLATFPQHQLLGGVLKDYKYARRILDRRRDQTLASTDPAFQPTPATLTTEDQMKLDLNSLFREVIDAFTTGTVTDLTYGALRRLVASLINTVPIIEDEGDLTTIEKTIEGAIADAIVIAEPARSRRGISVLADEQSGRRARHNRALEVLKKIKDFLEGYMKFIRGGTRSLKERQTSSKSIAKSVGLLGFADFKESQQQLAPPAQPPVVPPVGPPAPPPPPPPPAQGQGPSLPYDPDTQYTVTEHDTNHQSLDIPIDIPNDKTALYALDDADLLRLAYSTYKATGQGRRPTFTGKTKQELRNIIRKALAEKWNHPLMGFAPYTEPIDYYREFHD